jgi:hypothetical protein
MFPFPYSRLTKISLCKALPSRNAEESNLHKHNIDTKLKYSYFIFTILLNNYNYRKTLFTIPWGKNRVTKNLLSQKSLNSI